VITIAAGDELRLVVADDGDGIGDPNATGLGLKNLRQRAVRLGGDVELGRSREGGTRLTWHVPLGPAETSAASSV
jgi:signal transduction histidine kinase